MRRIRVMISTLKEGFVGIWKNRSMGLASLTTISLALLILGSVIISMLTMNQAVKDIEGKVNLVNVYLENGIQEDKTKKIEQIIKQKDGITALQMDMKISGINKEVLQEALADAHQARLKILDVITSAIDKPRDDLSKYAPRIFSIDVDPEKVRDVIGAGGKTINKIIDETGVKIETEDDGHITVASNDGDSGKKAIQMIKSIVTDPKAGDIYEGEVKRIMNFGAFVEIAIGKEGLLHISQIDTKRTEKVEDVLKIGDKVRVKVTEIDRQGRINLSRKALLIEEEKKQSKED